MQPDVYLLDTDICSYLQGPGYPLLKDKFKSIPPDLLATSAITRAEAWYGLTRKDFGLRRRMAAEEFFSGLQILDWPSSAASIYGQLRTQLERSGDQIDDHDILIASHAIAIDATLVTNNTRHFSRIGPPLRIENWVS
jgi:tRNA(fMet)-specific endonuclease VapC